MNVIGYARTSTDEQTNGMESQVKLLEDEAARRGWSIQIAKEHGSGKTLNRRPVLRDIIARLDRQGGALIVSKLDRLARSVIDFCEIVERSRKRKWTLIVLDSLDTNSPQGECMANMLASFAQLERRLISERTKNGLAVVKARGVQLGKPSQIPADTIQKIVDLRKQGHSLRRITSILNEEDVTAPKGKVWHTTTVVEILKRQEKQAEVLDHS